MITDRGEDALSVCEEWMGLHGNQMEKNARLLSAVTAARRAGVTRVKKTGLQLSPAAVTYYTSRI